MIDVFDFGEKYPHPVVLCLGRYESLHKGHMAIIRSARKLAERYGAKVALMTYDEGENPRFKGVILTYAERLGRLCGDVDAVMRVDFNEEFSSIGAEDFLGGLNKTLDLKGIVCGFDFRFGRDRTGDTETLARFCDGNAVALSVVEKKEENGQKIASSAVKEMLAAGDIVGANSMLGYKYFIRGKVEEGRKEGRKLGFPTANVPLPKDKRRVKPGVYATQVEIDGKVYKGITNVGGAPTFGESRELVETHLAGFSGDLYGREIVIEFSAYLREIKKFSSVEELKKQLNEDLSGL